MALPDLPRLKTTTQLQAAISAGDIASKGTATITVSDPERGISNGKTFTITSFPAPTVSSVSPSSVKRGSTKSLSISGNNFVPGASVEIRKTNSVPIACTNEVVPNSRKITFTVAIPSAASKGYWDIVVINPDGKTGTKARGFSVS